MLQPCRECSPDGKPWFRCNEGNCAPAALVQAVSHKYQHHRYVPRDSGTYGNSLGSGNMYCGSAPGNSDITGTGFRVSHKSRSMDTMTLLKQLQPCWLSPTTGKAVLTKSSDSERNYMKYHKTPVYVVSRRHKPLMPTYRFGHVRKLLEAGKAVPINIDIPTGKPVGFQRSMMSYDTLILCGLAKSPLRSPSIRKF